MNPGTRDIGEMEDGGVDAGLLLLSLTGRTYTHAEIAYVCGCSPGLIYWIEVEAKKKLRADPRIAVAWKGLNQ